MPQNPPAGYQRVIPYINYADAPAALEFLCKAFGFEEKFRLPMPDGRLGHAEVGYQGNVVMLASVYDEMGLASPRDLPARHSAILCYVDDVDAHHEQARAAGAKIVAKLEDKFYGDRSYTAEDLEGHHWHFSTHIRDVAPEDMNPPA
jgi:PhnB protein